MPANFIIYRRPVVRWPVAPSGHQPFPSGGFLFAMDPATTLSNGRLCWYHDDNSVIWQFPRLPTNYYNTLPFLVDDDLYLSTWEGGAEYYLWRWQANRYNWIPVCEGWNKPFRAGVVYNGNLVVCGPQRVRAPGESTWTNIQGVARLYGGVWEDMTMPAPVWPADQREVRDLIVYDGELLCCGLLANEHFSAFGPRYWGVNIWDPVGETFTNLGVWAAAPYVPASTYSYGRGWQFAVIGGDLHVGGSFGWDDLLGVSAHCIVRWNGTDWEQADQYTHASHHSDGEVDHLDELSDGRVLANARSLIQYDAGDGTLQHRGPIQWSGSTPTLMPITLPSVSGTVIAANLVATDVEATIRIFAGAGRWMHEWNPGGPAWDPIWEGVEGSTMRRGALQWP